MVNGGYLYKVVAACKTAIERAPGNTRFRFEYARALAYQPNLQASEIDSVRNTMEELDNIDYVDVTLFLGLSLTYNKDRSKNILYIEKARKLDSVEAIAALARTYDSEYYTSAEVKELWEEYISSGGADFSPYWRAIRDHGNNFNKYVELVALGLRRNDYNAWNEAGDLYQDSYICADCKEDRFSTANEYYLKAIQIGDSTYAAWKLAENYYYGRGLARDLQQSLYLDIFAIRGGETRGGDLLFNIIPESPVELDKLGIDSATLLKRVEDSATDKYSQYYMGHLLENQAKKDEALVWYRKASAQGLRSANEAVERLSKTSEAK
jgi:TPR repeat protein